MYNSLLIEPRKQNNKILYPVMEHFYSIQGEGFHSGVPAYFIRIAGCDIGCSWCDVKESWESTDDQYVEISELIETISKTKAKNIIITGGEPAMYNLEPLTSGLKKAGYIIHIETSGAYELSGSFDWICVSPKKFMSPLLNSLSKADELKVIVVNNNDLKWGSELAGNVSKKCKLFFQPEWERSSKTQSAIVDFIKNNPKWNLSLQIHKYLNIQ